MSDDEHVVQCKYCGKFRSITTAQMWWTPDYVQEDGRQVVIMLVYCSDYCGRNHGPGSVAA